MLGAPVSQSLIGNQAQIMAQMLAQSNLDQARLHKTVQNFDLALASYEQAKVNFKYIADARQLVPSLSEAKNALVQARTPETAEEEVLRQRIAEVYFERGELLDKLGKSDKAQASLCGREH
ncbi:hypothetical protein BGZ97_005419 [Linnemannia gamsii]|uniref:Uncharacterized protein n=1 Tax=Linnemannia gamsii TaxID=64522 RepID=A0A9P6UGB5_9FUNG|nr:hypothetical protein BGZ97_005419 [Linnemannia gamsii]